jgi:hypothetical protein
MSNIDGGEHHNNDDVTGVVIRQYWYDEAELVATQTDQVVDELSHSVIFVSFVAMSYSLCPSNSKSLLLPLS